MGRVLRGGEVGRRIGSAAAPSSPIERAKWIWHREGSPAESAPPGTHRFRRELVLDRAVESATFAMTADNSFDLWINGRSAGRGDDFHRAHVFDVAAMLRPGTNVLAVGPEIGGDAPNPAGLIGCLEIRFSGGEALDVPTDGRWWTSAAPAKEGWTVDLASAGGWSPALKLGPLGMAPWGQAGKREAPRDLYPSYDLVAGVLGGMGVVPDFEADAPLISTHRREGGVEARDPGIVEELPRVGIEEIDRARKG